MRPPLVREQRGSAPWPLLPPVWPGGRPAAMGRPAGAADHHRRHGEDLAADAVITAAFDRDTGLRSRRVGLSLFERSGSSCTPCAAASRVPWRGSPRQGHASHIAAESARRVRHRPAMSGDRVLTYRGGFCPAPGGNAPTGLRRRSAPEACRRGVAGVVVGTMSGAGAEAPAGPWLRCRSTESGNACTLGAVVTCDMSRVRPSRRRGRADRWTDPAGLPACRRPTPCKVEQLLAGCERQRRRQDELTRSEDGMQKCNYSCVVATVAPQCRFPDEVPSHRAAMVGQIQRRGRHSPHGVTFARSARDAGLPIGG
jgi:hypothetical protein